MKVLRCPGTINRPCRYELPESGFTASGEIVCPECGWRYVDASELSRRIRFKRNVLSLMASAVVLLALLGAGSYAFSTMDWPKDFPSAILVRRMPATGLAGSAVYKELETRARAGSLSASHQQRLLVAIESALPEDPDAWSPLISLVLHLKIGTPETVLRVIESRPRAISSRDASRMIWWMGAMPCEAVAGELLAIAEDPDWLGQVYNNRRTLGLPPSSMYFVGLAMDQLLEMRLHLTPEMLVRIDRMETHGDLELSRQRLILLGKCVICGDDVSNAEAYVCAACDWRVYKKRGGG